MTSALIELRRRFHHPGAHPQRADPKITPLQSTMYSGKQVGIFYAMAIDVRIFAAM